jgi:CheY-like chemotaxis protein
MRPAPTVVRSILAADDDLAMRNLYGGVLRRIGHDVTLAEDGQVALEILQQRDYDLLITDYMMPRMTGAELVRHVRRIGRDSTVIMPIIIASATTRSALSAIGTDERVFALQIPFDVDNFVGLLVRIFGPDFLPPRSA